MLQRTKKNQKDCKARAFTLVELLVVISIISMLIAILLPALSAARDAAQTVQCMSNLRQTGLGFHLYADDHNGKIIPFHVSGDTYPTWQAKLVGGGYVNISHDSDDINSVYSHAYDVMRCPAWHKKGSAPHLGGENFYGMMRYSSGSKIDHPQFVLGASYSPAIQPSKFPLLVDSIKTSSMEQSYYIAWHATSSFDHGRLIHLRHNGSANILGADNHVASVGIEGAVQDFSLKKKIGLFYKDGEMVLFN